MSYLTLTVEADFADLFEVKETRVQRSWDKSRQGMAGELRIRAFWQDV